MACVLTTFPVITVHHRSIRRVAKMRKPQSQSQNYLPPAQKLSQTLLGVSRLALFRLCAVADHRFCKSSSEAVRSLALALFRFCAVAGRRPFLEKYSEIDYRKQTMFFEINKLSKIIYERVNGN